MFGVTALLIFNLNNRRLSDIPSKQGLFSPVLPLLVSDT